MKNRAEPALSVILTPEDKTKFKQACKTAGPVEILTVAAFVNNYAARFADKDLRFMKSQIGQRCEHLLRNVVKNKSWIDGEED